MKSSFTLLVLALTSAAVFSSSSFAQVKAPAPTKKKHKPSILSQIDPDKVYEYGGYAIGGGVVGTATYEGMGFNNKLTVVKRDYFVKDYSKLKRRVKAEMTQEEILKHESPTIMTAEEIAKLSTENINGESQIVIEYSETEEMFRRRLVTGIQSDVTYKSFVAKDEAIKKALTRKISETEYSQTREIVVAGNDVDLLLKEASFLEEFKTPIISIRRTSLDLNRAVNRSTLYALIGVGIIAGDAMFSQSRKAE